MKSKGKRILSILMVVSLLLGLFPNMTMTVRAIEQRKEQPKNQTDVSISDNSEVKVNNNQDDDQTASALDQEKPTSDKEELTSEQEVGDSDQEETHGEVKEQESFGKINLVLYDDGFLSISGTGDYYRVDTDSYSNISDFRYSRYGSFLERNKSNIKNIRVENVTGITSTYGMFYHLEDVESIDCSGLDTSKVTDMSYMFYYCGYKNLSSLNLGEKFDTSQVTDMSYMFNGCGYKNLSSLDLGEKFDTSKVTDMSVMFYECGYKNLSSLNLGKKFDTSKVIDMNHMFERCGYGNLSSLDLGEKFDTSRVTDMSYMFDGCGSDKMSSLDLGDKFDTSKVVDMSYMFTQCGFDNLISLNLGDKFDTSSVINMTHMFNGCGREKMSSLDLGDKFDTSKVIDMSNMFEECGHNRMISLDLGDKFDTSKVKDMSCMFKNLLINRLNLGIAFKNIAAKNKDMFTYCGDYRIKVYASAEMTAILKNMTGLDFDRDNIITIESIDVSDMYKNCSKVANGSEQTFDIDIMNIEEGLTAYYSDKIQLNGSNYLKSGSLTKPSYTTPGKYTIYYYVISSLPNLVLQNNTGSFTFEIICKHQTKEVRGKVDATHEKDGYTGDVYCCICGIKLEDGQHIPKLSKTADTEFTLNVKVIPLQKGKTTNKVKAKVADDDEVIEYKSSNRKVATVSNTGVIKGIKKGTAKITYITKNGAKATLTVKVQNGPVKTSKLKVTNATNKEITMKKGKTVTLITEVTPITSSEKVSYQTSDKKVVSVSGTGKVKAIKKGKATVTVTSGKKKIKIKVDVK